jgi:acylphosphatase
VVVSGRVPGVGFRATARAVALGHPVTGWVRNEPDGTVTMEVQGTREDIDRCLAELRERMEGFVRGESSSAAEVVTGEAGFEIRR